MRSWKPQSVAGQQPRRADGKAGVSFADLTGAKHHGEASMFGRTIVAVVSVSALALCHFAHAEALEFSLRISDGPLSAGLKTLESQTGIELLYDGNVVREFRSPAVAGKLSTEAALQQMLSETD